MSSELALAYLEAAARQGAVGFEASAFGSTLRDVTAAPGRCRAVLLVGPEVCNFGDNLQGGCTAALVDVLSFAALLTVNARGGVSVGLHTDYLSTAPQGSRVAVEAEVVRAGQSLATVEVCLRDEATGELIAKGTHTMFTSRRQLPFAERLAQRAVKQQQQQQQQRGAAKAAAEHSHVTPPCANSKLCT